MDKTIQKPKHDPKKKRKTTWRRYVDYRSWWLANDNFMSG
jgi:hypothetical protein